MDIFVSDMLVKWARTMARLELEWKDILRDLIRWYKVPRWQYQPLLATNTVDKVAWMTTLFQNDLEKLESSVIRRVAAPAHGLDVLDDTEEPRMPGTWVFHIGRSDVQNTVVPTGWNSWGVSKPERWFEQYVPEMEHEEYEAARQDIENTLVEVLDNIPILPSRSGATHRLGDFVSAAHLLSQIWIYAGDNEHYRKECMLLAHRCSQVLLTTHRAILQGPLYSSSLSYIVEQLVDGLRGTEKFVKSLSLMRVYQAAVSYDPIERNIRNVNEDPSSIVDMFTITSSFGPNLRERLELGGFDASETEATGEYTMLRSAIDAVEVPPWVVSHTQIQTEKQIARGSSGLVFKGIYKGKIVVIKLLNDRSTPRESFSRRVNIWRSFLHVNIVPFVGASDPQRTPLRFLISPYCEYEDLITYLKADTDVQFATLLDMARDVAEGMRYLHGQDIVHRNSREPTYLSRRRAHARLLDSRTA
ncbi:hypothetical protein EWM64_g1813 [Hericium alpestre]|uniref:Protein kinase domain-containing protein n=1 Tax=Hericium alpestre TaxID=135208 RepID=A0A4Z0A8D9_9AGAM|nr:hypothetical protein EWM64_g1813 [Hericium alpestre]